MLYSVIMILEARIRKTEKGTVLAIIGEEEIYVKQIPGSVKYSNFYHRLRQGEKVFISPNSRRDCILVTNFELGMEDFFFQRMFGRKPPRRKDMTHYQKRVVSALNRSREYLH